MKKTLLALLLVLCLMVTLTAFTVSAEETETANETATHTHCVCGGGAVGVHEHACADIVWTPLSEALTAAGLTMQTANFGVLPSGNYYLDGDVTVTAATEPVTGTADAPGQQLSVCLNGHNITASGVTVFGCRKAFTNLNVCDCGGSMAADGTWTGGTITAAAVDGGVANLGADATATVYGGSFVGQTGGAYGSCFNLGEGSSSTALTIYNGYLKGGKTTDTGSVINASDVDATVNIYGGTIEGGGSAMGGGAIYMKAGTLTAENATIIGSTAPRGGAVVVKDGSFTNCTIIGGQSLAKESYTGSQDFNCGGAMAAFGNVTIENTTISDGQAQIGGNIYVGAEAVITIKGNTVIENGHAAGTVNAGGGRTSSNTITGHGGNIFVGNYNNKILGIVYMYDGEIRNGTADRPASVSQTGAGGNGGNVHIFGQFYMYGGKVYGGKAMANPAYQYDAENKSWTVKGSTRGLGGNFHLGNANGGNLLQIEGGYIYDGEAYGKAGGNIYATRGDVNLSGGKIWGGKANADNSVADTSATSGGTKYSPMADNGYVTGGSIYITGFGYAGTSKNYIYGARFTMTGGSIGIDADGNAAGGTVTTGGLGGNIYITRDTSYTAKGDSVYLKITGGTIANGTAPGGKGGNIYSYGNDYITVGGTAVISGGSAKYGGNIYYYNYGTCGELKIEGGTITGGNATDKGSGGNIYLGDGGILNMTAGTIEGGVSTGGGGNIYLSGISAKKVTANITGGTVSGGTIPSGYNGGNIRVNNSYATLNIGTEGSTEGPIIENGKTTGGSSGGNGGNISNAGTVNIYSGTISGGTATITTSAQYAYGGNIYSTKTLNIYGGTITDGDAYRGGNIYVQGTLEISGGVITKGVTKGIAKYHTEAHGGNIYQEKGTFTMTGGTVSEGNAEHNGGNAVICGTFDMTGGEMLNGQGTSGGNIRINASGTMTLDGGTVTGGKARSLSVAGGSGGNTILLLGNKAGLHSTLNVKSGTITGGRGNAVNGATILMSYGSIVNVTGGTITGGRALDRTYNNTFYPGRGGVFSLYGVSSTEDGVTTNYPAVLTISGGIIQNGEADSYGGLISCTKDSTSVEINITGGTFLGGKAPIGGHMWLTHGAVATISGGTFSGGEATDRAAGIYLGDATLKIVGAPTIQAIHMARAENQLLDVTEMTAEPIVFTFEQTGEHNMLATADVAAYIVNNQGYTITHENDKLYVTAPKAVYVSNNGSDSNNGTAEAPFKTLSFALTTVEDQGTVHVVDAVDVDGWNSHEKHVTVTGGELLFTDIRVELKDHVSFKNTTMVMPIEGYIVYCDGFSTLIDEDVKVYYIVNGERQTTSNDSFLYGGSRLTYVVENGEFSGTDLTVLAGDWGYIYGGNNTENPLNGDVKLTVGGNVNAGLDYATLGHTAPGSHHVYGGGKSDVNGTVNFTFTGNARAIHIFGCGYGAVHTENVVMNVTGGEGMSVIGGGSSKAQTTSQITVNYDGGTFEQVFGGSLSQDLTGNVDLYLNGGKISRRVYGGCYNDTEKTGLLTVSYKTAHQVTGNINMYIGGTDISCDLTEPGKNDKYEDLSIYAHSRYKATGTDAEISSIYFQNKTAYDTYKNKLKYNDAALSLGAGAMAQLMGGVTAADNLHYHDYAADGATIKYTCAYDANEFQGITAQLVLDDSVELIYKGKAIEPATIVYGENWDGELEIVYADNNKAGTATASITKDHATATLTFELADGPKMAKIGTTEYYSLQDAVNAATKETFVQLVDNIAEDVTVSKDLYLDLAGYSITGTVTVNEGAVLYGMDSTTDDYDCTEGNGTVKVAGEGTVATHYKTSVTGKVRRYLTYTEADGSLSFHRIYLGITSMSLRPSVKGVGYKATFRADSKAQELLNTADAFGYTLWLFDKDGNKLSATKGLAKEKFTNEGTVTLRLQNFDVENYGENEIYATVYLKLADGTQIVSSEYFYTLRSMIEKINSDTSGYSETQMKALQSMLGDSAEALQTAGWLISNIMNWSAQ